MDGLQRNGTSKLLVENLRRLLANRQIIVVVGAGVAQSATGNVPVSSWAGLLQDGIERCLELNLCTGLQAEAMSSSAQQGGADELIGVAESVTTLLNGPTGGEYGLWLRESVGALRVKDPSVIEALRDLNAPLATTNYDSLLEEITGRRPVTWQDKNLVERVLRGDEPGILHLHGHWERPESVVLGIRSYEEVTADPHAQTTLHAMRMMHSLLFVGYGAGLTDPNLGALLRWSREIFAGSDYRQFRLARASEVDSLQQLHPVEERVRVLSYGTTHDDLAPYLRALASPPAKNSQSESDPSSFNKPHVVDPIWNVPHARNPDFTGREEMLGNLLRTFADKGESREDTPTVVAVSGLGGIGKTDLAIEYVYRCAEKYDAVWWIRAEQASTIESDFTLLARELGLPEAIIQAQGSSRDSLTRAQGATIDAVRRWLEQTTRRWLLVLDNADHPNTVAPYLPRRGTGHVLITSRDAVWPARVKSLALSVLSPDESATLLHTGTESIDKAIAATLAEVLGFLPLALAQATAYVRARNLSLADYLERYRTQRREVLRRGEPDGYLATVASTWKLSFQAILDESPEAAALLSIMAFLAADSIPLEMFSSPVNDVPGPLQVILGNKVSLDDAIVALRRYSLVEVIDGNTLSLHHLVQDVIRDGLTSADERIWVAAAGRLLVEVLPEEGYDPQTWRPWNRLLPHAMRLVLTGEELQSSAQWLTALYGRLGVHLAARGRALEARPMLERSLALVEADHGPDDLELAIGLHHYARVLMDLADFRGAQQAVERALTIDQAAYGRMNLDVANDLGLLGNIVRQQGDLVGARQRHEQALAIREELLGPDDPQVATSLNDLGNVLRQQGDYRGAQQMHQRALEVHERVFGAEHPEVAVDLGNLGQDLHRLGEAALARRHHQRALEINEKLYGPEHPIVATGLGNLSRVLRTQNALLEARDLLERALAINVGVYGPNHPNVAVDLGNLADLLQQLGDFERARMLFEQSLRIQIEAYGPNHPRVATAENNLATLLERQGDFGEARIRFERALAIGEDTLGSDHPDMAIRALNLANVLRQSNELGEALQLVRRARRIYEQTEDSRLADVAQYLCLLAREFYDLGQYADARRAFQEALPLWRRVGDSANAQLVLRFLNRITEQELRQHESHE